MSAHSRAESIWKHPRTLRGGSAVSRVGGGRGAAGGGSEARAPGCTSVGAQDAVRADAACRGTHRTAVRGVDPKRSLARTRSSFHATESDLPQRLSALRASQTTALCTAESRDDVTSRSTERKHCSRTGVRGWYHLAFSGHLRREGAGGGRAPESQNAGPSTPSRFHHDPHLSLIKTEPPQQRRADRCVQRARGKYLNLAGHMHSGPTQFRLHCSTKAATDKM